MKVGLSRDKRSGVRDFLAGLLGFVSWTWLVVITMALLLFLLSGVRHTVRYIGGALGGGVALMVLARSGRRVPSRATLCAAGATVGLTLAELSLAGGPARDDLPTEGDGLVRDIESFRARSERYPQSLLEAGSRPAWNSYGGWQYESLQGGSSFHLWCGDYERDNFVLYWYPETGAWDWDT